jgi:phospholipid/cholesterol/gamma-HCH transport system permease protein
MQASGGIETQRPKDFLSRIGKGIFYGLEVIGQSTTCAMRMATSLTEIPKRADLILNEMLRIGNSSLFVASFLAFFVGMVLVVQTADQLEGYSQEVLGSIVGLSMTKELGPVLMAFLIAGRAGSAMAAELATMQVYEEVTALRTLDIRVESYLILPKFIATALALPMLILYADIVGILAGAFAVAIDPIIHISVSAYFRNLQTYLKFNDIIVGIIKGFVFGAVISVLSCSIGLRARRGTEDISSATTSAVVWSFITVIILDYIIARIVLIL